MCMMDANQGAPQNEGDRVVVVINNDNIKRIREPSKIQDNRVHLAAEVNFLNGLLRRALVNKNVKPPASASCGCSWFLTALQEIKDYVEL
ncbi:hypothetical protein L1987_03625 [Smallanthus sonchifolius]|uniref:Uncharacterized protein n=1 Tax=Smallanthus sonchifolius TaxID=185202 RepID=A0ACB9KB41_9ASTR|nr:hypothetical protein L1987_03625 [Smallanthus sonchifolius]